MKKHTNMNGQSELRFYACRTRKNNSIVFASARDIKERGDSAATSRLCKFHSPFPCKSMDPKLRSRMSPGQYEITAIYVTFRPSEILKKSLESIAPQCSKIIIVDNNSEEFPSEIQNQFPNLKILKLPYNMGVAAGLNKGIELAALWKSDFVLLLDQDSICEKNMVSELLKLFLFLKNKGEKIAAIGPRIILEQNMNPPLSIPFKKFSGCLRKSFYWDDPVPPIEFDRHMYEMSDRNTKTYSSYSPILEQNNCYIKCDYLITSGSLIPTEVFTQVGKFKEEFFIDYIDVEWGLRAKYKGIHCFGSRYAILYHQLGEKKYSDKQQDKKLIFMSSHAPFRYFYICRNALWLSKCSYIPLPVKIFFFVLSCARPFFLPFSSIDNKLQALKSMITGIYAGIFISPAKPNCNRKTENEIRNPH